MALNIDVAEPVKTAQNCAPVAGIVVAVAKVEAATAVVVVFALARFDGAVSTKAPAFAAVLVLALYYAAAVEQTVVDDYYYYPDEHPQDG